MLFMNMMLAAAEVAAQVTVDVKSFGAKGDGKTDDTKSFLAAVKKVNSIKSNVTLLIPVGNYLVYPQRRGSAGEGAFVGLDILSFNGCKNLTIKGATGSKISFGDNLRYGAFERKGNDAVAVSGVSRDYSQVISVGHGIYLHDCSGVSVSQLEINGNNGNFIFGGQYGDVGFQIDNDGIFIKDCNNITLNSLYLHHFGRDGIQIINQTKQGFSTPSQKLAMNKCRFEYNGRQGFSWTGGIGLTATDCSFSYTGAGKFSSPPGAGVDFEPNWGYVVKDGLFRNCTFSNNAGVAVISDMGGDNAKNMRFENCTITSQKAVAIWVKSPQFTFSECMIDGGFYFGYAATKAIDGTKFLDCTFKNEQSMKASTNYLIESNAARYLLFERCAFRPGKGKSALYINPLGGTPPEYPRLVDCKLYASGGFTTNVKYQGRTTFVATNSTIGWNIENSNFIGIPGKVNEIVAESGYHIATYGHVTIGDNITPVTLKVTGKSGLIMNNGSRLDILPKGKLVIGKGASLWIGIGTTLKVQGIIEVEDGAYVCIHQSAIVDKQSLSRIKIKGKAFYSDNPQNPYGLGGCIQL